MSIRYETAVRPHRRVARGIDRLAAELLETLPDRGDPFGAARAGVQLRDDHRRDRAHRLAVAKESGTEIRTSSTS